MVRTTEAAAALAQALARVEIVVALESRGVLGTAEEKSTFLPPLQTIMSFPLFARFTVRAVSKKHNTGISIRTLLGSVQGKKRV